MATLSGPMPDPLVVVIVFVVLAAIGYFVIQGRRAELPPGPEREALPPEPAKEDAESSAAPSAAPELPGPLEDLPVESLGPDDTTQPEIVVPLPVDKPRAGPAAIDRAATRTEERERYVKGLARTRGGFIARLDRLFRGAPKVDARLRDQIEEVLFTADIGTSTATRLFERVTEALSRRELADAEAVWGVIRAAALEILEIDRPATSVDAGPRPYVLLVIGVNGVGKTTTIGKLAARHTRAGRKVLLVAADTFRAAAVEQLEVWARRVGCGFHRGADRADPSSVVFEGIVRGRKEGYDVVLCDTAGRLHTRKELMDELAKVRRSATKAIAQGVPEPTRGDVTGPHDTFLVLDATIGQNALAQAEIFKEAMDFTGLVITKLDGTAKGGVVLGICDALRVPIRYIGIGEGIDDLRQFNAEHFADALFSERDRAGSEHAAAER